MPDLYIARQPIYDNKLELFAYELLYRNNETNAAPLNIGDQATYTVLINALTEIGLEELVGKHYAFINLTRGFLVGDNTMPFSGRQVVLEVLEDIPPDEDVINGVKRIAAEDHMIALDDFIYDDSMIELIKLCDIIKVDIMQFNLGELEHQVEILREYDVKLLAEKVETQEEYEQCKALGFDYYQGYFFCRPNLLKRQCIPASQLSLTRLMARLSDPNVDMEELNEIISGDVSLSYKLLRYVNSAFFSLPSKVSSIRQAVVYLGLNVVKRWALVVTMCSIDDKPLELISTALVRAKMCELIARAIDDNDAEGYFMVGLLSVLDALLDTPLEEAISSLSMSENINLALLNHEGNAGKALQSVLYFERGNWDEMDSVLLVDRDLILSIYVESIALAESVCEGIG